MKTPSSIKTDNGPAYTSSCFKQFLHFLLNILQVFLIIHRHKTYQTDTSHIKTTNKKIKKGAYTGTLLSSLSKADFTRFQHKIFSKPMTIVNTVLFV